MPIQWGGGVVAEMFSDLQKPCRFSGGGVVAEIFSDLRKPCRFSGGVGGGVVAPIFRITSPQTDPIRSRHRDTYHTFAHLPRYSAIDKPICQDTYTNNNSNFFFHFKWSRGGTCPPGPPWIRLCMYSSGTPFFLKHHQIRYLGILWNTFSRSTETMCKSFFFSRHFYCSCRNAKNGSVQLC